MEMTTKIAVFLLFSFFTSSVMAAQDQVVRHAVIISSPDNDHLHKIASQINERLIERNIESVLTTPDALDSQMSGSANLIISLGRSLTESAASRYPRKKILGLTTDRESNWQDLSDSNLHIISLLQPICRAISFADAIFHDDIRLAIISSDEAMLRDARRCRTDDIHIEAIQFEAGTPLSSTINLALEQDVLLALPDREVYNAATIRNVLLSTYRKRVPVIGYSRSFTKAGAIASIHSSRETITEDAVDSATRLLDDEHVERFQHPSSSDHTINERVSDALGIELKTIRSKER